MVLAKKASGKAAGKHFGFNFRAQNEPGFRARNEPGFRAQNEFGFRAQTELGFRAQNEHGFRAQNGHGFRAQNDLAREAPSKENTLGARYANSFWARKPCPF